MAIIVALVLVVVIGACYKMNPYCGSPCCLWFALAPCAVRVRRLRLPVVHAPDVENGLAPAADLAWRRRDWLMIFRVRTRQRATRQWAPHVFHQRPRVSDILSSSLYHVWHVVDRVIRMNESEIFRLVVSYL